MMQVSYAQLKRLFVIVVLFGLIMFNIHSFSSISMTKHSNKSDYHHQQEATPKQEQTGLSIHTIIRAVEGFVDQKLRLLEKDEQYLIREVRALREHQRALEVHIQDLELRKSEPEIRTTKIDLQRWYDTWKEEGLHIYPPAQSSIIINVGTNDILSNAIIESGYWVAFFLFIQPFLLFLMFCLVKSIDKLRDIIVVLSSMPPNVNYPNSNTVPFVDIGSNLGWFTLTVAGWGYYVESFEPMPLNNLLLSKSLRDNGMTDRVKHHPACLDHSKRSCAIISSEGNLNDGLSICESDENRLEESIKNTVFAVSSIFIHLLRSVFTNQNHVYSHTMFGRS